MRPDVIVAAAVAILALQTAPEPDVLTPAFVTHAAQALSPDRVLPEINRWPRRLKTPEPCQMLQLDLPNAQVGSSDGVQTILWADLEREIIWVEIVRGLDGRSEYRGPMRISQSSEFHVAKRKSIEDCRAASAAVTGRVDGLEKSE